MIKTHIGMGIAVACTGILIIGGITFFHRKTAEKPIQYQKQEDCFLCANEDRTLFSLYEEGIGVLNLNNLEIYTLMPEDNSTGSSSSINSNGEDRTVVEIDKNNSRRITDVTFRLHKDSKVDAEEMGKIMCEDCVNSILKDNTYDMSFFDFSTKEIIPLEDNRVQFFVGDYAVHRVSEDAKGQDKTLEYLVFYAPEPR